MSVDRWDARCVFALVQALTTDTTDAIAEWIGEHVTIDTSAWEDFALLLSGLAAAWIEDQARGVDVYVPRENPGDMHVEVLAVRMVSMMLNADQPGVQGVLAAVRQVDDWQPFCGALAAIAHRAMIGAPVVEVL